ncbi:receptor-type tyrosine-protein phosphatase S-like [Corticium candelabrum]|uniref:receptor-type tyrosine-protein phosphatase S-like n=1 Tax=Corticium candelabrum TaxID=121492 RepID=UPI002E259A7B|nr:receptor-type tyrosine-protein phosphatase S-like [Corticium candelabrum]
MHQDNNAGFTAEFKTITDVSHDFPAEDALANQSLNRYKNILTYDQFRVVLPTVSGMTNCDGNYIAAAYVDGYRISKKYIASQGPQQHTVADTWRMIWAENVPTVVMLTHLVEKAKIKCHQYWPQKVGDVVNYCGLTVNYLETDSFADYEIRKFNMTVGETTKTVTQYHFTAWPDHGVPKFATPLLSFIRRLNHEHPNDRGPMVVHCSAGVGRTGTFIVIDTMMEKLEDNEPIDIYSCVVSLRTRRQDMVQTEGQYSFIHDAILEASVCGQTGILAHNLRTAIAKLSKKDVKLGKTGFEKQFNLLQTTGPQLVKQLCKAGSQRAVVKKNRYQDIIPLDVQRVILRLEEAEEDSTYVNTQPGTDYINASHLDGHRRRNAFIITQGPLENTVTDFWKMMWEQNSVSVVMLSCLEENGQQMSHQYWPSSGSAQYGPYTVQLARELPQGSYIIRKMNLSKASESKIITQFQYLEWPENETPKSAVQLFDMIDQLLKWQQGTENKSITVHCNNGVGRTGTFCGIFSLIEQLKAEGIVDVFLKIRSMRIQSPRIVQSVHQYQFVYEALLSFVDSFETYANFKKTLSKVEASQYTVEATEYTNVTLLCVIEIPTNLSKSIVFEWVTVVDGNNSKVTAGSQTTEYYSNGTIKGALTFSPALQAYSGEYRCIAGNANGSTTSSNITFRVRYSPLLTSTPMMAYLKKNESHSLNCSAKSYPPAKYTWKKVDEDQTSVIIVQDQLDGNLVLHIVDYEDSGNYTCIAHNSVGSGTSSVAQVIVQGSPEDCSRPNVESCIPFEVNGTLGDCFDGNSPIIFHEVRLQRKDVPHVSWSFFVNGSVQTFRYRSTKFTPYAIYTFGINAVNKFGSGPLMMGTVRIAASDGTDLEPGPPQDIDVDEASIGESSVIVRWKQPSEPNGQISRYIVYYSRVTYVEMLFVNMEEQSEIIDPPRLWHNLTNLTPFTKYQIQVVAVNVRGRDGGDLVGMRSNTTVIQTKEGVPSAPIMLRVTPLPPSIIHVFWEAPVAMNGRLRNYSIKYFELGSSSTVNETVVGPRSTSFIIQGLEENSNYSIMVAAITVREGPPATEIVFLGVKIPFHPLNVHVSKSTSTSITVIWNSTELSKSRILNYKVYYRKATSEVVSVVMVPRSKLYVDLTNLSPYTKYKISVTAISNAKVDNESDRASTRGSTKIAAPVMPTINGTTISHLTSTSAVYLLPTVVDTNGPVSYVEVIVHIASIGEPLPSRSILPFPSDLSAFSDGVVWYITAHFNYTDYKSRHFKVGDNTKSADMHRNRAYSNVPLDSNLKYFVYTLVVAYNETNEIVYTYSDAAVVLPDREMSNSSSDGLSTVAVIVVVLVVLVGVFLLLFLFIIIIPRSAKLMSGELLVLTIFSRARKKLGISNKIRSHVLYTNSSAVNRRGFLASDMEAPTISNEGFNLVVTAFVGTTAVLPCDAAGVPEPTISWFFGGNQLQGNNQRVTHLRMGALQIEDVQLTDSGFYQCSASNILGQDSQNVEFIVKTNEVDDSPKSVVRNRMSTALYAVSVDEFSGYVDDMHADNNAGFSAQFEQLHQVRSEFPLTLAFCNSKKNRYETCLTYDHARVVLPFLEGMKNCDSDYINAAYIDGYRKSKKYIACQGKTMPSILRKHTYCVLVNVGPTRDTRADMWHMVWAENSSTIVMLTRLVENKRTKCHQYWPKAVKQSIDCNGIIVTLKTEMSFADCVLRTIHLQLGTESRVVKHCQFMLWPGHGVPAHSASLLYFWKRIQREHSADEGPIVLHCSSGVGRTGTLIVIDTMLDRAEDGELIDIYHCVATLRTRRQNMVQTEAQYVFIHDVLSEAFLSGSTEIKITEFQEYVRSLQSADRESEDGFKQQFEVLHAVTPAVQRHNCQFGSDPAVHDKNRYQDIIPLDDRRVVLQLESSTEEDDSSENALVGSDYINASFVDSYLKRDAFIVTQGPLVSTVADFWQMIWQQDCQTIVMLTKLEEGGMDMCCQYWPSSGSATHGSIMVTMEVEMPGVEYSIRRITMSKDSEKKTVTQFQFTSWQEGKSPSRSTQLLDLLIQVQKIQRKTGNRTLTVHCNNGIGRTGTFCALLSLIESLQVEGVIDVFSRIKVLRTQHPGIVQTLEQYVFCHTVIMEYLDGFGHMLH